MTIGRVGHVVLALAALFSSGCGPRVIVVTGTTVGLKATPGDGQTRPPQLVVGYKRAEAAVIPVEGDGATHSGDTQKDKEAASTVASFYLESHWMGRTDIRAFIGTGFAARKVAESTDFAHVFQQERTK